VVTTSADSQTNRPFFISPGGGIIEVADGAAELALTGPVTGAGALIKLGSGQLRWVNDKAHTGNVIVAEGAFALEGNLSGAVNVFDLGVLSTVGATARSVGDLNLTG